MLSVFLQVFFSGNKIPSGIPGNFFPEAVQA
jgi:hypothetical protein